MILACNPVFHPPCAPFSLFYSHSSTSDSGDMELHLACSLLMLQCEHRCSINKITKSYHLCQESDHLYISLHCLSPPSPFLFNEASVNVLASLLIFQVLAMCVIMVEVMLNCSLSIPSITQGTRCGRPKQPVWGATSH